MKDEVMFWLRRLVFIVRPFPLFVDSNDKDNYRKELSSMANQEHLDILKQGVEVWNRWRMNNPNIVPDLSGTDLHGADLGEINLTFAHLTYANLCNATLCWADLSGANLSHADLKWANLRRADFSSARISEELLRLADRSKQKRMISDFLSANLEAANLSEADLYEAKLGGVKLRNAILIRTDFRRADLFKADLTRANLSRALLNGANLARATLNGAILKQALLTGANLSEADLIKSDLADANLNSAVLSNANLREANLTCADLTRAILIRTNLRKSIITNSSVFGISAWETQLEDAMQNDLVITLPYQPTITIDNLEIAQFVYLLLNNSKIRDVIDTIAKKAVLILGRFTPERKAVLDTLREALRKKNYLPIMFDFEKPSSRDFTETVSTLAHLARFIIVDLTDPSSVPHEVATIIPQTVVPVQPLLALQPLIVDGVTVERHEYAMFEDLRRRYHWVLPTFRYQDTKDLLASLSKYVIEPAELKAQELAKR